MGGAFTSGHLIGQSLFWFGFGSIGIPFGLVCLTRVRLFIHFVVAYTMASIDEFVKAPTRAQLQDLTKDQLLDVAKHYKINVSKSSQRTKESIISALDDGLVALEILSLEAGKEVKTVESGLSFAEQK